MSARFAIALYAINLGVLRHHFFRKDFLSKTDGKRETMAHDLRTASLL
jgi:hypothetical protein